MLSTSSTAIRKRHLQELQREGSEAEPDRDAVEQKDDDLGVDETEADLLERVLHVDDRRLRNLKIQQTILSDNFC